MKKRALCILMTLALALGLFPATVCAADQPWAADAVTTLNGIYGSGVFQATDTVMTESDAAAVLAKMGCASTKLNASSAIAVLLARAKACEVLAEVYQLEVGTESAIQYLYNKNIINGTVDGTLDEDGAVTQAQFAVLAYRVLNFVGGGKGSSVEALKPGTDEYFNWMYLSARRCVNFSDANSAYTIGSDTAVWSDWIDRLNELDDTEGGPSGSFDPTIPDGSTTLLDAAGQMVDACIAAGGTPYIFYDVVPGHWAYDGVMYLFDHGIISGYGNGDFGPDDVLKRYEFAALLYRIDPNASQVNTDGVTINIPETLDADTKNILNNAGMQAVMKYAVAKDYVSWADGQMSDFDPTATVTRQTAMADILKVCMDTNSITLDLNTVNTAVLDRFADCGKVTADTEAYVAYAVSLGLMKGTSDGALDLDSTATRAQAGVLLYRTLIGLDTTKMKDYEENVGYALASWGGDEA